MLLFKLAFDMAFAKRQRQTETEEAEAHTRDDVAVFPLAIPLNARPGAFATILVLTTEIDSQREYLATLISALLAVLILTYVGFRLVTPIHRIRGDTATAVITRVLGILLAALAVQLVIDAVLALR